MKKDKTAVTAKNPSRKNKNQLQSNGFNKEVQSRQYIIGVEPIEYLELASNVMNAQHLKQDSLTERNPIKITFS